MSLHSWLPQWAACLQTPSSALTFSDQYYIIRLQDFTKIALKSCDALIAPVDRITFCSSRAIFTNTETLLKIVKMSLYQIYCFALLHEKYDLN